MNKKHLKIEKTIYNSLGKIGYIAIFSILFLILMFCIDFILYCFVDNYFSSKFIFTGELSFNEWFLLMRKTYSFPYFKMALFGIIFIFISNYRIKTIKDQLT